MDIEPTNLHNIICSLFREVEYLVRLLLYKTPTNDILRWQLSRVYPPVQFVLH